jgi:ketosteroid isomerase-like protein
MTSEPVVTDAVLALDRRSAVASLFEALSEQRMDDARALMAADAVWWVLAKRQDVPIDPWLDGYRILIGKLFPNGLTFDLGGWTIDGPRVAVQARSLGARLDGRVYNNDYHFLVEFAGTKIAKVWEYGDTLHAERVLRG